MVGPLTSLRPLLFAVRVHSPAIKIFIKKVSLFNTDFKKSFQDVV